MPSMKLVLTAVVAISVAAGGSALLQTGAVAGGEFHSKGGDVNTVDPSMNNLNEGLRRIKAGDLDGAIDSLQQSIDFARNNYDPTAYYWLGMCYKKKNQDGKAIEAFKKHLEQTTTPSPWGHVDLGEVYMRNDRDGEAEQEFNKALAEGTGGGARAHNAIGKLHDKHGDYTSANWDYIQALGDPPWRFGEAWMNLIENYMKQTEWVAAIQQINTMLAQQKMKNLVFGIDYARVNTDLGVCKFAKGDHQGALQAWQQACVNDPLKAQPHLLLAKLFDEEKHITSAVHEYEKYIALAPNEKGIDQVKARMEYLQSLVQPKEAPAEAAKPSPFMRQQLQQQIERKQQAQDQYRMQMESLKNQAQQAQQGQSKDSGF